MITAILIQDSKLRDAMVGELGLEKDIHNTNESFSVYRKAKYIIILADSFDEQKIKNIQELFDPEHLVFAFVGTSLSDQHQEGDVILPNVFVPYNPSINDVTLNKENRDDFMGKALFLENYEEQEDYLSGDYGVSVGGILVYNAPKDMDDERMTNTHIAYESDIYIHDDISPVVVLAQQDKDIIILTGVLSGKKSSGRGTTDNYSWVTHHLVLSLREMTK